MIVPFVSRDDFFLGLTLRGNICHKNLSQIFVTNICHTYLSQVFVTHICHKYLYPSAGYTNDDEDLPPRMRRAAVSVLWGGYD